MRGKRVTARHAIDGRRLLESETASLAAQARTDEDITVIQAAIDSLSEQDDLLDRVRADLSFHLGVARASHNPVLEAMFGAMSGLAAELMLRSLSDPDVAKAALPQHSEILRAIVARDSAVARETMICHLEVAITHYGDDLDLELETIAERRLRDVVGVRKTLDDLFRLAAGIERTGGGGAN
jgi:GntR family transcriptional repressor for pyruvate dehydrogenase complex